MYGRGVANSKEMSASFVKLENYVSPLFWDSCFFDGFKQVSAFHGRESRDGVPSKGSRESSIILKGKGNGMGFNFVDVVNKVTSFGISSGGRKDGVLSSDLKRSS